MRIKEFNDLTNNTIENKCELGKHICSYVDGDGLFENVNWDNISDDKYYNLGHKILTWSGFSDVLEGLVKHINDTSNTKDISDSLYEDLKGVVEDILITNDKSYIYNNKTFTYEVIE